MMRWWPGRGGNVCVPSGSPMLAGFMWTHTLSTRIEYDPVISKWPPDLYPSRFKGACHLGWNRGVDRHTWQLLPHTVLMLNAVMGDTILLLLSLPVWVNMLHKTHETCFFWGLGTGWWPEQMKQGDVRLLAAQTTFDISYCTIHVLAYYKLQGTPEWIKAGFNTVPWEWNPPEKSSLKAHSFRSQCTQRTVVPFHPHQHLCGRHSRPEAKRNTLGISQCIVSKGQLLWLHWAETGLTSAHAALWLVHGINSKKNSKIRKVSTCLHCNGDSLLVCLSYAQQVWSTLCK